MILDKGVKQKYPTSTYSRCLTMIIIINSDIILCRRCILNFLVGVLDGNPCKSMLYHSVDLMQPPNHELVMKEFLLSLEVLFNNVSYYKFIKIINTDSVGYNKKFIRLLKQDSKFSHIYHIGCFAHLIHNVAEKLRGYTRNLDKFILNFQKFLIPIKISNEYKNFTKLKIPPKYVKTR